MGVFSNGKCKSNVRLEGKISVITGANKGIGYETALDLLSRGARVILACRSLERANIAAERLQTAVPGGQVRVIALDLSSLRSVTECARELLRSEPAIHLLINNAGLITKKHSLTEDGFESTFQANHLGHYLFTRLLLPKIKDSAPARIVNVSSFYHHIGKIKFEDLQGNKKFDGLTAYSQSKLCSVLFTLELTQQLKGTGVVAYAVHPGAVHTDITDVNPGIGGFLVRHSHWALKTPKEGAQTTLHCALDDKLAEQNERIYYSDCEVAYTSRRGRNKELAAKVWKVSEQLVAPFL